MQSNPPQFGYGFWFGAGCGVLAAILGVLILVGVAPENATIDGAAFVLLGVSRLIP